MAEEIKAYRQYIYKNWQFRKTSGGGGAEIRVVDTLPELGEPNVLYVLDDGTQQPSSKGAVVEDTITIKEMKLVPSVAARKITSSNGDVLWVPDPISLLDTSNVEDMNNIFNGCNKLITIPSLDVGKCTALGSAFTNCRALTTIYMKNIKVSFDISTTALQHDAIVELINNGLATITTTQTLTMGSTKLALLSDSEKQVALDKGWTLA